MLKLEPMEQSDYDAYLADAVTSYANEKVKAGTWQESLAFQEASKTYQRLLPDGFLTSDQYFFKVVNNGTKIGHVWFAKSTENPETAFIYDIGIAKGYQDQGYGTKLMPLIDDAAKKNGFKKIALHVFGHNKRAIHVYEKSGYQVTDVNMEKEIK